LLKLSDFGFAKMVSD
jgi:serine/threonine protein kinase